MTAQAEMPAELVGPEPTALQSFWASILAIVTKESRWRMRGRRAFVIVTIYLTLLALLVFAVYQLMYDQAVQRAAWEGDFASADVVSGLLSAVIGQAVFVAILVVQTLLTVLIAPALTSGAISIEREKQTLELLITTPVSTLAMVVGKLFSSLAYVLLLIVASIPLASIVFAFGGIAPEDFVRGYAMLFAVAFGIGSIGLFLSALFKRSQVATALSYVIVFALVVGSLVLHTYLLATSVPLPGRFGFEPPPSPPEAILWLNPLVADVDLICTAIPESFGATCAYTSIVTGLEMDPANPPRDVYWPRSAAAFVILGIALTLGTTQLIAPSRRVRRDRSRSGRGAAAGAAAGAAVAEAPPLASVEDLPAPTSDPG